MSNPPPTPNNPNAPRPRNPDDDALAALHKFAAGTPPIDAHAADNDDISPSASGFVGMLAKGLPADPEPTGPEPINTIPPIAHPIPHADGTAGSGFHDPSHTHELREAREIRPPAPRTSTAEAAPAARSTTRRRRVPSWYKPAVPVMFTVSSLLFIIGFWAVGAVIFWMAGATGYPLMATDSFIDYNTGETIHKLTPLSKTMALIMLTCLPVAILLSLMGFIMSRQVAASERR